MAGKVSLLSLSGPRSGPLMATVAAGDGTVDRRTSSSGPVPRGCDWPSRFTTNLPCRPPTLNDAPPTAAPAGSPPISSRTTPPEDEETEEEPRYGDYVDHFVFGLCEVMTVRDERMKIRNVTGVRKLREIHLGAMKVLKPTEQQGKRAVQARPPSEAGESRASRRAEIHRFRSNDRSCRSARQSELMRFNQ